MAARYTWPRGSRAARLFPVMANAAVDQRRCELLGAHLARLADGDRGLARQV